MAQFDTISYPVASPATRPRSVFAEAATRGICRLLASFALALTLLLAAGGKLPVKAQDMPMTGDELQLASCGDDDGEEEDGEGEEDDDDDNGGQYRVVVVGESEQVNEGETAVFTLTRTCVGGDDDDEEEEGDDDEGEIEKAGELAVAIDIEVPEGTLVGSPPVEVTFNRGMATVRVELETLDDQVDEADAALALTVRSGTGYNEGESPSMATITVLDNDDPSISAAATPPAVVEGEEVVFTLTRIEAEPRGARTVQFSVSDPGGILSRTPQTSADFAAGDDTVEVMLDTTDNDADAPNASVMLTLTAQPGVRVGSPATAIVQDNDDPPTISVMAETGSVAEGTAANFVFTRTAGAGAAAVTLSVDVEDSGSRLQSAAPATFTIPAGMVSATLTLATSQDNTDAPDGTVTVGLNPGTGYIVGDPATATVAVTDDDHPTITVVAEAETVYEGQFAVFTLTRASEDLSSALTVMYELTDPASLVTATRRDVSFAAGSATARVAILVDNDLDAAADAANAMVTLTLDPGSNYTIGVSPGDAASVSVRDNDGAAEVTLTRTGSTGAITEGESIELEFRRSDGDLGSALAVTVAFTDPYGLLSTGESTLVEFGPDQTAVSRTLTIQDNTFDQPNSDLVIELVASVGYDFGTSTRVAVNVRDNDLPVITVTAIPDQVTEGERVVFAVTRVTKDLTRAIQVNFTISDPGNALISGGNRMQVTIPAMQDTVIAGPNMGFGSHNDAGTQPDDRQVTLTLSADASYTLGSPSSAVVTVLDNDGLSYITVVPDATPIVEGDTVKFRLQRFAGSIDNELDVYFAVTDPSGAVNYNDPDYSLPDGLPQSTTFPPNQRSVDVYIPTVDDGLDELDSTITLALSAPAEATYTLLGFTTAQVQVLDNDLPVVTVEAVSPRVTESDDIEFRVIRAGLLDSALTVSVALSDQYGALDATSDIPTEVVFVVDESQKTLTFSTKSDSTPEANSTVSLSVLLDGSTVYKLGDPSVAEVVVVDDDDASFVVRPSEIDITEGRRFDIEVERKSFDGQSHNFWLQLSGPAEVSDINGENDYYLELNGQRLLAPYAFTLGSSDLDVQVDVFTIRDSAYEPGEYISFGVIYANQDSAPFVVLNVNIKDPNDPPLLSVKNAKKVNEGEKLIFPVELTANSDGTVTGNTEITVPYMLSGTATSRDDFTDPNVTDENRREIVIPPGATMASIVLNTLHDREDNEGEETVVVTLGIPRPHGSAELIHGEATNEGGETVAMGGGGTVARGVIAQPPPKVSISDAETEEGRALEFDVTLSVQSEQTLTVTWELGDCTALSGADCLATAGADFTSTPGGVIVFQEWERQKTIVVPTVNDDIVEATEDLVVRLVSIESSDQSLSDDESPSVDDSVGAGLIIDNDMSEMSIENVRSEEGEEFQFVVSLSTPADLEVMVDYETSDGTATASTAQQTGDYTGKAGTLTFAPGDVQEVIRVQTAEDSLDEANESFTVELSNLRPSGSITFVDSSAIATIEDDDLPVVTVTAGTSPIMEGEDATFTLTRTDGDIGEALNVRFVITAPDYILASGAPVTATIPARSTETTVTLPTVDDNVNRPDVNITLDLSDWPTYELESSSSSATVMVEDNESIPQISVANASIEEGQVLSFAVSVDPASHRQINVNYALTDDTATAGTDYTDTSTVLTFLPEEGEKIIAVPTVDDTLVEPDEMLTVTLSNLVTEGSAELASDPTATGTIRDNDLPRISVRAPLNSVSEEIGSFTPFTLTRDGVLTREITVDFTLSSSGGSMLTGTLPTFVTFRANEATATVMLETDDDSLDELDSVVTLEIVDPGSSGDYALGAIYSTSITITDNDVSAFSIGDAQESEGNSITFTVNRSVDSTRSINVTWNLGDPSDTAIAGEDYPSDNVTGMLTFAPGEMSKQFTIATIENSIAQDDREFTAAIEVDVDPNVATVSDATATGTILDDDEDSVLSLAISDNSIVEAGGMATLTMSTGGTTFATDQMITLTFSGAATPGTDYTVSGDGVSAVDGNSNEYVLTLAMGESSATATVTATQDDIDEGDGEDISVTAAIGPEDPVGPVSLTITDDDIPALSISSVSAIEEGRVVTFTVDMSIPSTRQITVAWDLGAVGDTATAVDDYVDGGGTLTFIAMDQQETFTVQTVNDRLDEEDGTFTATISGQSPTDVTISNDAATVTITDNDNPPALSLEIAPDTISENGEITTLTVSTGDSVFADEQTVILSFSGTATLGVDYTVTGDEVSDNGGEYQLTLDALADSASATITAVQDQIDEGTGETVEVSATQSGAATAFGTDSLTIVDDDGTTGLTLDILPAAIDEDGGEATLTVSTGGTTFTVPQTVVLTFGGAATLGTDYTVGGDAVSVSGGEYHLTLASGETSAEATITAVDDNIDEGDGEAVNVSAALDGEAAFGTSTLTITDDDSAPELSVSFSDGSIAEDGGTSTLTVLTGDTTFATGQTVILTFGGAATLDTDYTVTGDAVSVNSGVYQLALAAGASSAAATVTATDDNIDEGEGEAVSVSAALDGAVAFGTDALTITDDDDAPDLSVSFSDGSIAEDGGTSTLTVLTGDTTFATGQTVILTFSGTATLGTDYTVTGDAVSVNSGVYQLALVAGASSATATVTATDDIIDEGDGETVEVSAALDGAESFGSDTLTITDDDAVPTPSLEISPSSIAENGGEATVTVSTGDTTFATDQTVNLTFSGAATPVTDYTVSVSPVPGGSNIYPLTLAAGASSVSVTVTAVQDAVDEGAGEAVNISAALGSASSFASSTLTITDDDDGATGLTVDISPAAINEAGGTATVTVSTGGTIFATPQTVILTFGGVATPVDDYTVTGSSVSAVGGDGDEYQLTLAAGDTSAEATITAVPDEIDEGAGEAVEVSAALPGAASAFGTDTLTITDDDVPVLSIIGGSAVEGNAVAFTVDLSIVSTQLITVAWALTPGTASTGDYVDASGTLTFNADDRRKVFSVRTVEDSLDEPNETFIVTLSGLTGGAVLTADPTATGTINDDDAEPVLSLGISPASIDEDGGEATLTVSTGASTFVAGQTVVLTFSGDATPAADYGVSGDGVTGSGDSYRFTLGAGETSASATVTAVQDLIDEGMGETVEVSAALDGESAFGMGTLTITDDDIAPTLELSIAPSSIAENLGAATLTVSTVDTTFATPQTVTLTFSGAATPEDDYTVSGDGVSGSGDSYQLVLGAGVSSATATVTAVQDVIDEGDGETVAVSAALGSATAFGNGTLTITDDDDAPVLALSISPASIDEGGGAATGTAMVTVSTGATTFATGQTIVLTFSGVAALGTDYMVSGGTRNGASYQLALAAGTFSAAATVTAVDDVIDEGAGETVSVSAALDGESEFASGTLTITDDDAVPVLALSISPDEIVENGGEATLTVSTGATTFAADQTVNLTFSGGATPAVDYTVAGASRNGVPYQLTLAAGTSSAVVTATAVQDNMDEGDGETVEVSAALAGADEFGSGSFTITDDDAAPVLALSISPEEIAENGGVATLTVSTGATTFAADQTVNLTFSGAATPAVDYAVSVDPAAGSSAIYPLTLTAGTSTISATVTAVQDVIDEGDGEIAAVSAALDGADEFGSGTLTIVDDDGAPELALAVAPVSIAEAGGTATLTVSTGETTFATAQTVVLTFAGIATPVTDYTVSGASPNGASYQLTLAAATSSAVVTVSAVQDVIDEGDGETVEVSAALDGADEFGSGSFTIADDDDAPVLALAVAPSSIAEAGGIATVTVSTGDTTYAAPQTVDLTFSGVAAPDDDYTVSGASGSGTSYQLTLAAAASSAVATVTAVQDEIDEGAGETVAVSAALSGAAAEFGSGSITITDDDGTPALSIAGGSAREGNAVTFTVDLSRASSRQITVDWDLGDSADTATAVDDYADVDGELVFAAGDMRKTFTVQTVADRLDEEDETFTASLSMVEPAGAATLPSPDAIGTINDDDGEPVLALQISPASIAEDGGMATLTVSTGDSTFAADQTVVLTFSGDATPVADYTVSGAGVSGSAASYRFTLGAGETSASATVRAVQDLIDEGTGETVEVSAALDGESAFGMGMLAIADDDEAPVLELSISPASIAENQGAATLTVSTVDTTFATPQTVTLTFSGAATPEDDYTVSGDGVSGSGDSYQLALGAATSSATATVTAVQDVIDEGDGETVVVSAAMGSAVAFGSGSLTITDDDAAPVLALSISPASIDENGGAATGTAMVTVSTGATTFAAGQTIVLTFSGAATLDADYTVSGGTRNGAAYQLALAAAASSAVATVTAVDDVIDEGAGETVVVGAALDGESEFDSGTLTITDDDAAPTLDLEISPISIAEATGEATLTVTTGDTTFAADQTVVLTFSGVATPVTDYTVSGASGSGASYQLALAAGTSSAAATVTAVQDDIDEGAGESVEVSAALSGAASAFRDRSLTIADDDDTPALSIVGGSAEEGDSITFTVEMNRASSRQITVDWELGGAGDSATAGSDYTDSDGELVFAAGDMRKTFTVQTLEDMLDEDDETVTAILSGEMPAAAATLPAQGASGTITDENVPSFSIDDASATEGDTVIFIVRRSIPSFRSIDVAWDLAEGTAAAGDDYTDNTDGTDMLTFAPADMTREIRVDTRNNDMSDGSRTFMATITTAVAGAVATISDGSATGTINDDETPTLSIAPSRADEGDDVTFTVTLEPATFREVTVQYAVEVSSEASAASMADFDSTVSGSLSFGIGETMKTFAVPTTGDGDDEPDETFTARISNPSEGAELTANPSAAGTITDDDVPDLTIGDSSVEEGGDVTFTVEMDIPSYRDIAVSYTLAAGTATATTDFSSAGGSVTIMEGNTEATITVGTVNDQADEPDEDFTVTIVSPGAAIATVGRGTATGAILDNDVPVLSISGGRADEGADITFTVSMDITSYQDISVSYTLAEETATADSDFPSAGGSVTILEGNTAATFTVAANDDLLDEPDETFTATITTPDTAAATVGSQGAATGTIADTDVPVLSLTSDTATEGGILEFTARLDIASYRQFTVDWDLGAAADTAAAGADYTDGGGELDFAAGDLSKTFTVQTLDDMLDEEDETLTVSLSGLMPADAVTLPPDATGTITDENVPSFTINDASAVEGRMVTFTVEKSIASYRDIVVTWDLAAGTATAGTDYTDGTDGTETLTFGPTEMAKQFTVATIDNDASDGSRAFMATISTDEPPEVATISDGSAVGTITDDETPTLSIAPASAQEGSDITFTVTLAPATFQGVTVDYAVRLSSAANAASSTDFAIAASGELSFEIGETEKTFTVSTTGDGDDEPDEIFVAEISDPSDGAALGASSANGTILDNDVPSFSLTSSASATEGGSMEFTASLDIPSYRQITVGWAFGDAADTATGGTDYSNTTGRLTFAAGVQEQRFTVQTTHDTSDEADETFTVSLSSVMPAGAANLPSQSSIGTILDNDVPVLAIHGGSAAEDSGVTFTVSLDGASYRDIEVSYTLVSGTATADTDFPAAGGSVTVMAGDTSATFTVDAIDDSLDEPDETFTARVTSPGATVATVGTQGSATGTITDNDVPVLSISGGSAGEGDPVTFTVEMSIASSRRITVDWALGDSADTATVNDDYTDTAGRLTFAAGSTAPQTFTVQTTPDTRDERDETFTAMLSNPTSGVDLAANPTATGTITDDDVPVFSITADGPATEGSPVTFTVRKSIVSYRSIDVTWSLSDGTATSTGAGADYTVPAGNALSFGPTDTSMRFSVPTIDNTESDGTREFTAAIATVVAASVATISSAQGAATGTIHDDETPTLAVSSASAEEGDSLTFTVTLAPATFQRVTVGYAAAARTGAGGASSADFASGAAGTLTFESGVGEQTFTVSTVEDGADEPDELFDVTLSQATGGAVIGTPRATGTIRDDDVPVLRFSDASATEGGGMEFEAILDPVSYRRITVAWTLAPGTATAPDDYESASGTLAFNAGVRRQTFTVQTAPDDIFEGEETFTAMLANLSPAGAATLNPATATGTIRDDDSKPSVSMTAAATVVEGGDLRFTVTMSPASAEQVTMAYALGGGDSTATSADYTDQTVGGSPLMFEPGSTEKTIVLRTVDDSEDEEVETVQVTLSTPAPAAAADLGPSSTGVGTINDNDLPTITVSAQRSSVAEGEDAVFVLARMGVLTGELTVRFAVADPQSALTAAAPTQATFPAGSATVEVPLATDDDSVDEPNATLTLTLASGADYAGAPASTSVTVTDNEGPPEISILTPFHVSEGQSMEFRVQLSHASARPLTVDYALAGGSAHPATAGADYRDITAGGSPLAFAPGVTSMSIALDLIEDGLIEETETVIATLANQRPSLAASLHLSHYTATGRIFDGILPEVSISPPYLSVPAGEDAVFHISRAQDDMAEALTVSLDIGSSRPDLLVDPAMARDIVIPANLMETVLRLQTRNVVSDSPAGSSGGRQTGGEPPVTVTVEVLEPPPEVHYVLNPRAYRSTVTVVSSDAMTVQVPLTSLREGASTTISVDADTPFDTDQVIEFRFSGDAQDGTDFEVIAADGETLAAPYRLTLPAGATRVDAKLAALSDGVVEGDESLMLSVVRLSDSALIGEVEFLIVDNVVSLLADARVFGAGTMLRYHIDRFQHLSSTVATSRLDGSELRHLYAAGADGVDDFRAILREAESADGGSDAYADANAYAKDTLGWWSPWTSLAYGQVDGRGYGEVYDGYAGIDVLGESGDFVLGWLIGYEDGDLEYDGVDYSSAHVQAGTYGATRVGDGMTLDGAFSWGVGEPRVRSDGVGAKFRSQRAVARASLTGRVKWNFARADVAPQIGALYARENLAQFTDSTGATGPSERLSIMRAQAGAKMDWAFDRFRVHSQPLLYWDKHNLDGWWRWHVSMSVKSRMVIDLGEGVTLGLHGGVDGLGIAGHYRSFTTGFSLRSRF